MCLCRLRIGYGIIAYNHSTLHFKGCFWPLSIYIKADNNKGYRKLRIIDLGRNDAKIITMYVVFEIAYF